MDELPFSSMYLLYKFKCSNVATTFYLVYDLFNQLGSSWGSWSKAFCYIPQFPWERSVFKNSYWAPFKEDACELLILYF